MLPERKIPMTALLLALLAGAVSLSQEIVWVRVVGFTTASAPETFAHTLGSFLIGIAIGALIGRRICSSRKDITFAAAWMLGLSALIFYFSLPLAAKFAAANYSWPVLVLVCLTAAASGGVFPVVCQLASELGAAGKAVSWIYLLNIAGATLGSLFTGFILLNAFPLRDVAGVITASGALASAAAFMLAQEATVTRLSRAVIGLIIAVVPLFISDLMFSGFLENLQYEKQYPRSQAFKKTVENRSGIITVDDAHEPGDADIVYGGGIYDGRYAIDPRSPNGIHRCYMIAALHHEPNTVLEIGFSSGSWAAALLRHEAVRELQVVEINPGYLKVINDYEEHAKLLQDSRVDIKIDDGRRWLGLQPDNVKFDFMLMNTTFHWRSYATNLLSVEFLELCKRHLKPGGVLFYNTTGSDDVVRTAAAVFEHVTMVGNFVAASDKRFDITGEERRCQLLRFKDADGAPTFLRTPEFETELDRLVKMELPDLGQTMRQSNNFRVITDDNMACEFPRRSGYWFSEQNSWGKMFQKITPN